MELAKLLELIARSLRDNLSIKLTVELNPKPKRKRKPTPKRNRETTPTSTTRTELHDTKKSYELLDACGVNGEDLPRLAVTHSPNRITDVLAQLEKRKDVRNKAGYLRRALDNGWYRNHRK